VFGDSLSTKTKNQIEAVENLFVYGLGTGQGTAWDAYNAYAEWIDHHRSTNPESQVANAALGADNLKEHAFNVAMSL
jgi:hypothetical protein